MKCERPRQAVILAGGVGSRLRPLTAETPKPMIRFHGKPFSEYLLEMLKEQGFEEFLFLSGYLADQVKDYFGDGHRWGVRVLHSMLPPEAETGTRLIHALPMLQKEFFLAYCDNYCPIHFPALWEHFQKVGGEALLTIYANDDGYTQSNVRVGPSGLIEIYDKSRKADGLAGVEIGFGIFSKNMVERLPVGNISFERELYPELIKEGKLVGFVTSHRYYSVGSFRRLPMTGEFLERKPAILLDRDGTLNRRAAKADYIRRPEDFIWLPGALEALKLLKEYGFRIFIITNQAGVARGMITNEQLESVHGKMEYEAASAGGKIDGIYVCPHHWDDNCLCRKPKPGMLLQAQREHHLDLSRTWFLGDDERDVQAGNAAGCKTGMVTVESSLIGWTKKILSNSPK